MRKVEAAQPVDLSWPHLRPAKHAPLRAMASQRLFLANAKRLKSQLVMPNGEIFGTGAGEFANGGAPAVRITDPDCFFTRIGRDGPLGLGESFLLGAWRVGDGEEMTAADYDELVAWLTEYASILPRSRSAAARWLRNLWLRTLPAAEGNSVDGARRNVQAHYDLDTELFKLFLDPTMTYSSAWFDGADDLAEAQLRKIDAVLDLAHVQSGTRLLDIGCGYGALAIRAAERGAEVTGITLSQTQLKHATHRANELGLQDRVTFMLQDYREHQGSYDAITCVEMIEAVGSAFWPAFFTSLDRLVKAGGYCCLQAVTFPHEVMRATRGSYSWVDRYIFPGGELPSLEEIALLVNTYTGFEIGLVRRLDDSYARTLKTWRDRFLTAVSDVGDLGFDERFVRLWALYFSYFEAGFRARYCDVWQVALGKQR